MLRMLGTSRTNTAPTTRSLSGTHSCLVVFGVAAVLLTAAGCESRVDIPVEVDGAAAEPGSLRSAVRLTHYPALVSRALLWSVDLSTELPVEHGTTLYRVEYWTEGTKRERTHASGLVALTSAPQARAVISYQHPTQTDRANVPSTPSRTGLLAAIAFAGHGYILVAPDYVGLGTSPGPHPYLHAESEARAVIDLLRAARTLVRHIGRDWPSHLFLTGFSQGGHASLAAQRALEADPVPELRVSASAPIAGLYDLSGIQFPFALEGHSERHALYLGALTAGYAHVYDESPASILRAPYATRIGELFDGSKDGEQVMNALPADPKDMFREEFLRALPDSEVTWLERALIENDVHDWKPQAPIRFYYGTGDRDSPASDTRATAEHMRRKGGAITAVNLGARDHNGVVFAAIPEVRRWFDSLSAVEAPPVR